MVILFSIPRTFVIYENFINKVNKVFFKCVCTKINCKDEFSKVLEKRDRWLEAAKKPQDGYHQVSL